MNNYNNMSDADLLSLLNSMADEFENKAASQNNMTKSSEVNSNVNNNEPQPVSVDKWEDMEITLNDAPSAYSSLNEPEQDMPIINPLYTMDKDGNIVFSNMRPSQQNSAFRITPERGMTPDYGNMSILEKRRKALFESEFGMSYSYKKSWETLLHSIIARFPDARAINIFGIKGGLVIAKNLEVDPVNFTDDKLGINLYDLIEFHTLFKMLPNIEMLVLDEDATKRLVLAYGDTAQGIWNMFQEEKTLRLLRIKTSEGWKDHRRESFSTTADNLDKELQESRAKLEIQHKFDVVNPRKSEMTKGRIHSIKNTTKEMRQHSFGIAKEAFMAPRPKLIRSVLYTGIGLGCAAVCGVTSAISGVVSLIKG